jgi:hypothetical protein
LVKHVQSTGVVDPAWPSGGVDLGASNGSKLIPDGSGGVYVVYAALSDLYAIRLASTGAAAAGWAGGKALVVAAGAQSEQVAVGDGSGGLLIAWTDARDDAISGTDIYVTRFDANGNRSSGWLAQGTRVCGAPGAQRRPSLAADGDGGALVTWIDGRSDLECSGVGCGQDIYWSRVVSTGALDPNVIADGNAVSTQVGDQSDPLIIRAAAGTAIVAWLDGSLVPDGDPAWVTQVVAQRIAFDAVTGVRPSFVSALGRPQPNPAGESTRLQLTLAEAHPGERVDVDVFDISGRAVRGLYSAPAVAGTSLVEWDLRSSAGARVPAGLYFVRMRYPGGVFTRGVIVR